VQNREKCHLHALSVLACTIKKMTVFYLEMINDDFDCARGGFPPVAGHRLVACVEISLSRLSPLPAPPAISALIRQHRGQRGESGNGTVCRSSCEYTNGNPRRQAKDPAVECTKYVEQKNNDASRNSGLNLSLQYATVVPYSVLH
jgi:hypothetical protein